MRLPSGGRVDRSDVLEFTVDGVPRTGLRGDTVASALIADGVVEVAPSIYRGRPRGIFTADGAEPNALVEVAGRASMRPATTVELVAGLRARTLSGIGRLDPEPDPAIYDRMFVHADAVVVGGGPAGIRAALDASREGARVVLVDDGPELGGGLLSGGDPVDGVPALEWVAAAAAELAGRPEARVLLRSSAVGLYDHGYVLIAERRTDHLDEPPPNVSRERLWHVRAREVVLATGARERPLVFEGNDLPGVMLASALRTYAGRFAAVPDGEVVVATTNDSAYAVARDLITVGVPVAVLVDARSEPPPGLAADLEAAGVRVIPGSAVCGGLGESRLVGAEIRRLRRDGGIASSSLSMPCAVLAVSGGWSPDVALLGQAGGRLRWDDDAVGFVPDVIPRGVRCVGAAAGELMPAERPPRPLWLVPSSFGDASTWHEHFVDLQRDATVADVWRAAGAGMRSVEHVKRYTTIGTGQDQGRTSGVAAVGLVAEALGATSPGDLGTTTFRPPAVPVSFAAFAGRDVGALHDPVRTTPLHAWHVAAGAVFEDVGQWKRPRYYPRAGEDLESAVLRECHAARTGVAAQDVTTLGKVEVVGPDAGEFLNRMYTNAFAGLPVGSARYGMLCTADGMVMDDGVVMRLAPDRYVLTTTTGGAARVLGWFEEWLQTEWPQLRVSLTSVTEHWATVAVVGPRSRDVVARLAPGLDCSAAGFGFMAIRDTVLSGAVEGVPARIVRVSFSGELAYEVSVVAGHGLALWEAVLGAGADLGITPYGTEAMHVLRAEKGYPIVGQDTDGTVTPFDLGMGWLVSKRKDFVGKRSLRRADTARPDRKHLVGLLPKDPGDLLPEGAQLVAEGWEPGDGGPARMIGHVTSSYRSAALERTFALALVVGGRERLDETVLAPLGDRTIAATVTEPVFYDPAGARRDGDPDVGSAVPGPTPASGSGTSPATPGASSEASSGTLAEEVGVGASALAHRADDLARAPSVGIQLAEARSRAMVNLRVAPESAAAERIASRLGVVRLPGPNRVATAAGRAVLWLGPDEWLVVGTGEPAAEARALADALNGALGDDRGSVVDVSAGRAAVTLSGGRARDLLQKGCSIDLHPSAFGPGHCAQTLLARASVLLWQTAPDPHPTYEVMVGRSFAGYLADWLIDAAKEWAPR